MDEEIRDTHQKALAVNLSRGQYGTIAEIGAGQETARWFFRAGGAAGTVAKTMSAYDMRFSDSIYGPAPRYVCRERLCSMLQHEYQLLLERLDQQRGAESTFFAFANTVAARSFSRKADGHGWLGIRFQTHAREAPSDIHLHVNLHGKNNVQDQETLGILGVNLVYASMKLCGDHEKLMLSLMDQLSMELLEIDLLDFAGPAFTDVDNRLVALRLVQNGFAGATMFSSDGQVTQVAEALWQKAVLIERSRFRPPTYLTMALMDRAQEAFLKETNIAADHMAVLSEMTLKNLANTEGEEIDPKDFLFRADILCDLGKDVLVSNYGEYYKLAQYLFRYTKEPIALVMGIPTLREIFNDKYYEQLPGGILESFGRLFKHDLRLYICAEIDPDSGSRVGVNDFKVSPHLQHLYDYLLENNFLRPLDDIDEDYLRIFSHDVLKKIQKNEKGWEKFVPDQVAQMIKEKQLFNLPVGNSQKTT